MSVVTLAYQDGEEQPEVACIGLDETSTVESLLTDASGSAEMRQSNVSDANAATLKSKALDCLVQHETGDFSSKQLMANANWCWALACVASQRAISYTLCQQRSEEHLLSTRLQRLARKILLA